MSRPNSVYLFSLEPKSSPIADILAACYLFFWIDLWCNFNVFRWYACICVATNSWSYLAGLLVWIWKIEIAVIQESYLCCLLSIPEIILIIKPMIIISMCAYHFNVRDKDFLRTIYSIWHNSGHVNFEPYGSRNCKIKIWTQSIGQPANPIINWPNYSFISFHWNYFLKWLPFGLGLCIPFEFCNTVI